MENQVSQTLPPPSTSKAKNPPKTVAVTLRLPKWWVKKLRDLARHISADEEYDLNLQALIREAVRRVFMSEDRRSILKREGVLSESDRLRLLKQLWITKPHQEYLKQNPLK